MPPDTAPASLPPRLAGLGELAANLWWSWHHGARALFAGLSPALWRECGENPVLLLRRISPAALASAAADPAFVARYDRVMWDFRQDLDGRRGWYEESGPGGPAVAYFSAEFGLHQSLPIYAGGLGFLAGDHLKECSDLHVPLVGVGLLYGEGYLRQRIGADSRQEDAPEPLDRGCAPLRPVTDNDGAPVSVTVELDGAGCEVRAWRADVGRVPLYLLDTDHDGNPPALRGITRRLYAGDCALRLRQEAVLGIGGRRLLSELGFESAAIHLNEGHPALALLELLRERLAAGEPLAEAVGAVRARAVFTTHTPVPAGFDVYDWALVESVLGGYLDRYGCSRDDLFALGRHPGAPADGFNMAVLALRLSGAANAVSARHGEVSRALFAPLWPGLAEGSVPVGAVTNGVHLPTWLAPSMAGLLDRHLSSVCPGWRDDHDHEAVWGLVDGIPDRELWDVRLELKARLAARLREDARRAFAADAGSSACAACGALLDPAVLTIGFARRFSTYKRADLVFSDPDRLRRILTDTERPVQLVFAGKAHPADGDGGRLLQRVHAFARDPAFEGRVAFMEGYGAASAPDLVRGVDVWLNTPAPPLEASGTSGMKAAMNGVVNCSVLDGWWLEGYDGANGWAVGGDGPAGADRAASDARALYTLLETEIVPRYYYDRGPDGVPRAWVETVKASMRTCAPRFSARRMVKEYVRHYYGGLRTGPDAARSSSAGAHPAPAIVPDEEVLLVSSEE